MDELIEQERTVTLHLDINYAASIMIRDIKKGLRISREKVVEDAISLLYEKFKKDSAKPESTQKKAK